MKFNPILCILASLFLQCCMANVLYYDFVLENVNFTRLCYTKSIFVANGILPGPAIRAQKGDTIYVNVHNQGPYGVTIHWHGVRNPRNPWSDGPEYITQCPLLPGANFTYEVILSTEEGTVWWHAHSDWSRATLHGAITVAPAEGTTLPFPTPDAEEIIIFGSWYLNDVMKIEEDTLESGGQAILSNAYTINGQPGDFYNCSADSTYRMTVDHGKTYLLKIINSVMNTDMFFAIAAHNLTVVGWDGAYVKPINTRYIMITPGQTMDVLVTANQNLSHYYMIASPYFDGQADDFDETITSGIFQYSGNYTPPAHPLYPSYVPTFENVTAAAEFLKRFRSLNSPEHPITVPQNPTTRMFITTSINMGKCVNDSCLGPDGNRITAGLNNITFQNPSMDILQAYYRNISGFFQGDFPDLPEVYYNFTADDLMTDNVTLSKVGTKVKMLNFNESVEIIFQGTNVMASSENHPVHIHGFRFYVLGKGVGVFDNETDPLTYNLIDPPEANTVGVPKDGWATIRFYADNPGVWFMHCHFDRHMSWGMDSAFIVRSGGTEETTMLPPPDLMPTCDVESRVGYDSSMLEMKK